MATQNKQIELIELGLTSYKRALAIQEDLFNKIILVKRANRQNTCLLYTSDAADE